MCKGQEQGRDPTSPPVLSVSFAPHLTMVAEDARQEGGGRDGMNGENKNNPSLHEPTAHPSFCSYFAIVNGHGEVDAQSLENFLLLVGISLTPAQVEDALMSADVDSESGESSF